MSKASKRNSIRRTLILIAGLTFLGSTIAMIAGSIFNNRPVPTNPNINIANADVEAQLKQKEEGYEQVLTREPDNPVVLQALVETRLQLGEYENAIAPIDKLIELYPQEESLKQLKTAVEQQAQQTNPEPANE